MTSSSLNLSILSTKILEFKDALKKIKSTFNNYYFAQQKLINSYELHEELLQLLIHVNYLKNANLFYQDIANKIRKNLFPQLADFLINNSNEFININKLQNVLLKEI
jgi:hypothetical protein